MIFGSQLADDVIADLDALGFERLLAVPAAPVTNARRIRYPVRAHTTVEDGQWYVRSFGTTFDLVDPFRRAARGRWYSLGWGLAEGRQVAELLLVQAEEEDSAEVAGLVRYFDGEFDRYAIRRTSEVTRGRWYNELRVAAVFDRMSGEGS
ncbi:MAG TPA: hypothetical protein VGN81_06830 [Pseudonocardiaceae bacterium]|jgi:hypothetical protein